CQAGEVGKRLILREMDSGDGATSVTARHLGEEGCPPGGQPGSIGAADLTDVRAMRDGPAHRIHRGVADDQIEIGAVRTEWIVAWRADLGARLPPTVLTADDPRV